METTTSKIVQVSSKFYEKGNKRYYSIEFENGDKGTISAESDGLYKIGDELKYKLTAQRDNPDKFWVNIAKDKKGGFAQKNYNAEFAMKALECASRSGIENVYELADQYFDWLKKKSLSSSQSTNG